MAVLKSYVIPPLWMLVIAMPVMGITKSIASAGLLLAGLILYGMLKKKKPAGAVRRSRYVDMLRKHIDGLLQRHLRRYGPALVLAVFIILPLFMNSYAVDVLTSALLYTMLALGLNLLVGNVGLLNLGYIAFYGIGAYTYAVLYARFGLGFWDAVLLGGTAASVVSLVIAIPTLRLKGDYFAIVTLGFGEIVRIVFNNWDSLTNGPNGIMGIPRPSLLGLQLSTGTEFFYLTLLFVIVQVYVLSRIDRSRLGRYALAINENEQASEMVGINTYRVKAIYFMLSAFFGGIAGVLFASKQMFVSPDSFTFTESVYVLAMVILGGMGNIAGVIAGAFTLVVLPEVLRGFVVYRMLIFALLLITMMLFRPEGLVGRKAYHDR
ncbi:MAG: branched-chain amino acid ABC transporter permease [Deltaproteobacteria bacterium]|nr:branched-chain amino acid ABC transporter permease [Deltaproteobacteria bacterium]MCL5277140.1 branched-chain amino acid ABC transporter permease [Deltaproteobacteria bacterium]